jgi:hypothetical protein
MLGITISFFAVQSGTANATTKRRRLQELSSWRSSFCEHAAWLRDSLNAMLLVFLINHNNFLCLAASAREQL